jgi:hypothetical protein
MPPVFLVQRNQIEEVLRYQVWADAQLRRHLREATRCMELTELGCMTPAGARARLTQIARAMHAASCEFAKIARCALKPARKAEMERTPAPIPVPHGLPPEPEPVSRSWQWQGTHPAAGCLAFEAADWNDQLAVAELWIQRAVHRALTLRAAGEHLAVSMDGMERARSIMEELGKQLEYATQDFWTRFTLAEGLGMDRTALAAFAAA